MILYYFTLGSGISACALLMQGSQRKYAVIPENLGVILSRWFSFFLGLKQDNWSFLLQKLVVLLL